MGRQCEIVVVDDSAEIRELLRVALDNAPDFRVVAEATDGRSGLDAVVRHRPDVALLDLAMPVMDGLETLTHLRSACPETPVVMLSGSGTWTDVQRALDAGAAGYIQKGMSIRVILDRLRQVAGLPSRQVRAEHRGMEAWGPGTIQDD